MHVKCLLLLGLICLSGCFGNSKPTRYYLLNATAGSGSQISQTGKQRGVVLVGPLELAKYLDRSNLVSRVGANELLVSDLEVWGEGLDRSIANTIATNLSQESSLSSFTFIPWSNLAPAEFELPLSVDRFDCDDSGFCQVRIFSNNPDIGNAEETMPAIIDGPDVTISFNAKYVTDVLKNLTSDTFYFSLNETLSPAAVRQPEDDTFTYIVTPVRTAAH